MSNPSGSRLRHGHSNRKSGAATPEYVAWMGMRNRCNSDVSRAYHRYGGRGIKVDPRWDSYENFLIDMGPRPSPQHSLDRIDVDKGYSPENCRWATWKEQQRNRSNNKLYTVNGITATLPEHCERTGANYKTAHRRMVVGASIETAISPGRPRYGQIKREAEAKNAAR